MNGLILSEHFSAMMEQLEAAVECREPAHAKFVKEYADDVQKIINELETLSGQEITESYIPNRELTLDSKRFDEALSTLSVLAPNMTATQERMQLNSIYRKHNTHSAEPLKKLYKRKPPPALPTPRTVIRGSKLARPTAPIS